MFLVKELLRNMYYNKNHKCMALQKLSVPDSLDYVTASGEGTPTPYEEGQHTEMHLLGAGDTDQTVLKFNALGSRGQKNSCFMCST